MTYRFFSFLTLTFLFLLPLSNQASQGAEPVLLASGGESGYAIVVPDAGTAVQQTAASELRDYIRQIADVELPVMSESEASAAGRLDSLEDAKLFIIGPCATSQKALGELDESSIGYDGIILKNVGSSFVLSGTADRGVLFAVYEFLEEKLGVRWWTSTETRIPRAPEGRIEIDPTLDVFYAPRIQTRESFCLCAFEKFFSAHTRCNGARAPIPAEYGGRRTFAYGCHSSFMLIPPEKYFIEHPEWFSEIDGERQVCRPGDYSSSYNEFKAQLRPEQIAARGTQLCFSNDEMLEELIKNARAELRSNPEVAFLDVSQNDNEGWCTCEKCRAIDEEEGSHAGSLLRAVNKIAEALEEEFPDVLVETLAYTYTRKPPKITKPRSNVLIRLCSIECSFAEPIDSETNKEFRDDLLGWSEIAENLYVWDYVTDFGLYLLPFPNYRVLAPNLLFFADHHVIGVMEQGDYHSPTGDFLEMRNWIISKLLWNPELDPDALRDEFVAGYYAPELVDAYRDYFNVLSDAVERSGVSLGIYRMDAADWMTLDDINRATKALNAADEIAARVEREEPEEHKGLTDKVRRGRIPLQLVWLQEYKRFKQESEEEGKEFLGPADPAQAAREFNAALDEYGVSRHRESCWKEYYEQFRHDLVAQFEEQEEEEGKK